jgi:hypothetical protein
MKTEIIKQLIDLEISKANAIYGEKFSSDHEAYSVILEEVEECADEFEKLIPFGLMENLRHCIRTNANTNDTLAEICKVAINLALEAVQVTAMAKRAMGYTVYQVENHEVIVIQLEKSSNIELIQLNNYIVGRQSFTTVSKLCFDCFQLDLV